MVASGSRSDGPGGVTFTPVVVEPASYPLVAAAYLAQALIVAARRKGDRVTLALSGGHGPRPVFERLAAIPAVPWRVVEIYFADERAVPPDHPEGNYTLVQECLVSRLAESPAAVHRMRADHASLEEAAGEYARLLPAALDILVLGIGEDGHTASLFPGHPEVREEDRRVVPAMGPSAPQARLTITPPVIRSALARIMLVSGLNKATAVARACEGPKDPNGCPAQLARDGTWIMDRPAASLLGRG